MLKPRKRLVNFRVTEEEYAGLKAACSTKGARCLSDYARLVMLPHAVEMQAAGSAAGGGPGRLEELGRRLEFLEANVGRMMLAMRVDVAAGRAG
jgi:hypothetical protein